MTQSTDTILIYATDWCFDCRRVRKFFDRYSLPYQWINIDRDPQAEQIVLQTNKGMRSVPTLFFPDGSILVEPSERQLRLKLNISEPQV